MQLFFKVDNFQLPGRPLAFLPIKQTLIFFEVTVKKCRSKTYNYINDQADDPAFCFGMHIKDLLERY